MREGVCSLCVFALWTLNSQTNALHVISTNHNYAYQSDKPTSKHSILTERERALTKQNKKYTQNSTAPIRCLLSGSISIKLKNNEEVTFLNQTKEHFVKNNTYVPLIRTENSSICSAVAGLSHTRIFTARDVSQLGWLMRDIKNMQKRAL